MAVPMTSIISTYLLLNADLTKESRSKAPFEGGSRQAASPTYSVAVRTQSITG